MQQEIIVSGFGGQGTLFAGQMLAHAAMDAGRHVTWIPSYGPEMRGGKARCTVVVSDEEVGAPVVSRPSAAIVLNLPSFEAFEGAIKPGGVLVVNSSLITARSARTDIQAFHVPATVIAEEIGNVRLANMVCLGVLIGAMDIVSQDDINKAVETYLPARHHRLLGKNLEAVQRGIAIAQEG